MAFYDPHAHLLLKQFFWFMVLSSTYVYLIPSNSPAVLLYVCKTAAKESKSWGCVWKSPTVQKSLPLATLPQFAAASTQGVRPGSITHTMSGLVSWALDS